MDHELRHRALKTAADLPVGHPTRKGILNVLARLSPAVPIGSTVETPHVRIHRFADVVRVWDLTNAGKRGRKVDILSFSNYYLQGNDIAMAKYERWLANAAQGATFKEIERTAEALIRELSRTIDYGIELKHWTERGVDVDPPETVSPRVKYTVLDTPERVITVEAKPSDVSIREVIHRVNDRGERQFYLHDTVVANTRKKRETKTLYKWVVDNERALKGAKTLADIRKLLNREGIPYTTYDLGG